MIQKYSEFSFKPRIKEIITSEGAILVGLDAQSNDHLTFNIAGPEDTWLHVKAHPGSHVVIKSVSPSLDLIKQAAQLAKAHSKAKHLPSAEVSYCLQKYISKSPGAAPGEVSLVSKKTFTIKIS
jgi:predicted ribosome quality control (RQC) complex YloA/Tae2 family protein